MTILQGVLGVVVPSLVGANLIVKSADQGPVGTSFVDADELVFNVAAGLKYLVEWGLKSTCNTGNGLFQITCSATIDRAGGRSLAYPMSPDTTPDVFGGGDYSLEATDVDATPQTFDTTGTASSTNTDKHVGWAIIAPSTFGVVKVQFRSVTGSSVTMRAGSWLRWTQLP